MRSKLSWITFIPLLLAAGFLRAARWIFPEGTIFNLSNLVLDYIFLGAVVLVFLFTALFCLIDKRICVYYLPHRNFAALIFGIIIAFAFAADGAVSLIGIISTHQVDVLELIESILLIISGIVFVVLALTHCIKGRKDNNLSLLSIFPALLCAVRMIIIFVSFTTISLKLADVASLICYVFATLFFFNYAVTLSHIKAKRAVKSCMIFGFPAVAALLPYGAVKLIFSFDSAELVNNLDGAEAVLIGLYILSFLIELTAFARDKDSVRIVFEEDEPIVDDIPEADVEDDGFVVDPEDKEAELDTSEFLGNMDTSDYLYRDTQANDDNSIYGTYGTYGTYGAYGNYGNYDNEEADSYLTHYDDIEPDEDDRPQDYTSRLDEIDKLILEISEKSD